jgi:hypothetical protein
MTNIGEKNDAKKEDIAKAALEGYALGRTDLKESTEITEAPDTFKNRARVCLC